MLAVGKVLVREQAIVPVLPWKSNDFLESEVNRIFVQGLGSKNWIFLFGMVNQSLSNRNGNLR